MGAVLNEVLKFSNIQKAFGGMKVLDGVSAQLRPGEVVLLRGENGSGKTTLLNILTGNLPADGGEVSLRTRKGQKKFHFPLSWRNQFNFAPEFVAHAGVGRAWQEVHLFQTQNLQDNIAVANPRQLGENPIWALFKRKRVLKQEKQLKEKAVAVLNGLNLEGRENSYADQISLGQSRRVAIAQAIATGAEILFLDEPLAGLDAEGVQHITEFLRRIIAEHKLSLVIVEHIFNIPAILDMVTTVWTLKEGQIEVKKPDAIDWGISEGFRNWLGDAFGKKHAIEERKLPGGAAWTTLAVAKNGKTSMQIQNLVAYRGRRPVVGIYRDTETKGLSLSANKGCIHFLQAPNGWGKTTLLDALAGLLPAADGKVLLQQCDMRPLNTWQRAKRGIQFLQSRDHTFPMLTVKESLRLSRVRTVPEPVKPFLHRRVGTLSGGQRQLVALVCALESDRPTNVYLLDEPFSAFDEKNLHWLTTRLLQKAKTNAVFIAVPSGH